MTTHSEPANTVFLSPGWLDTRVGRLAAPDPAPRSTVALRLTLTDPPPGVVTATDVLVDLAGGRLSVTRAGGEAPGLLIALPYAAAHDLLLGPARARVEVLERGDVTVAGNFSLLFFIDAALERDRAGQVAALREGTAVPPGSVRAPAARDAPRAAVAAPPADAEAVERATEALPRTLRELRREVGDSTPGAQVYVSLDGKTLADAGLGMARPGVAMSADSAPLWYCCAKPLLSVALGGLWEQGDFDPYLPVAHYLPAFGTGGKAAITSMELLTHTGPVATGQDPLHGVVAGPDEERLRRALGAVLPPRGPEAADAPAGINYSQWWAWFVLAELLPVIDGRDYAGYVEEEILRPCGMDRTRVHLTPDDYDAYGDQLPLIHVSNLGDTPQPTYFWSTRAATTRPIPGVNTRGPLSDLGRLLEMLLAGGTAPGGRVLSPTTVAALTGRHRTGVRDRYGNADWGFGVRLECRSLGEEFTSFSHHASPRAFGHDGLWTATAFADPATQLAVAVHLNGKVEHERHRERIFRITDAVHQDLGLV